MRIDDLNRAPLTQTQGADKTDQPGEKPANQNHGIADGTDQAEVSQLAQALAAHQPARLEQLKLQVASGQYEVPAQALAQSIVEAHLKE